MNVNLQKLRDKTSKLISLKLLRASIFVSISRVISSLTNLIFMIYAVNLLSKTENGAFQYYLGFAPIILAVAEFGLPNSMVRYLSPKITEKEYIGSILSASLIIKLIMFLLLLIFGLGFSFYYQEDLIVIYILILGGLITSFVSYFESIYVSFGFYLSLSIWIPLTNVIRLLILFYSDKVIKVDLTNIELITIFSISPIFILVLFFFIFPSKQLYWSAKFSDMLDRIKELSLYNSWAFAASMFAITSDRLEVFIIKKYHPSDQVAVYGTALQLFSGFVIIFSTLNSLVLPKLSKLYNNKEEFKRILLKSIFVSFSIGMILMPGIYLAEFILNLFFGNKYNDSIPIFKILYPNYLMQLVFAPMGIALFALGKPKVLALLAFLRLLFGYAFDTMFIPEHGAIGASISFFLGQIVSWIVLTIYMWNYFRKPSENSTP